MPSYTFSRNSRLLKPAEFQRVFADARRSADRYFTVLYRDNDTAAPRIGFAVAKKKIPSAVARNRVRRLARESFRVEGRTLGGIDIIILAQNAAASAGNRQLFESLQQHWQRLASRHNNGDSQRNRNRGNRPRRQRTR